MTIEPNRRSLVTGVPALLALALPAAAANDDALIDILWIERTRIVSETRANARAYREAEARLPEWASAGPSYLYSDGSYGGPDVGWPRRDAKPPERGYINVRPSPDDIRRDFELYVSVWGRRV